MLDEKVSSSTLQSIGAVMKVVYLLLQSTTTIMLLHPSNLSRLVIKSMETLSNDPDASYKGSNNPVESW